MAERNISCSCLNPRKAMAPSPPRLPPKAIPSILNREFQAQQCHDYFGVESYSRAILKAITLRCPSGLLKCWAKDLA